MIIRNPRFTFFAIVIIGALGLPPLVYGVLLMLYADPPPVLSDDLKVVNLVEPQPITLTPTYDTEENAYVKRVVIDFETMVVFEGDEITISAKAFDVDPRVLAVYLFLTDRDHDIKSLTGDNLAREINSGINSRQVLQLFDTTEPKFQTSEEIPFLEANQNVVIKGVVVLYDTTQHHIELNKPVFTVHPKTEKLEAQTNSAVIKLVNETRTSNWEQEKTNNLILGLTYIGIGAIPFLVGTDILIRIYLKENSTDKLELNLKNYVKRFSSFFSNIRSK